jgi:hypothetical protein
LVRSWFCAKFLVAPWKSPIGTFVGFLEIISEISKLVSFTFRLFGNIFAGEVLLIVMSFLMPYVVPIPFLGLEMFVGEMVPLENAREKYVSELLVRMASPGFEEKTLEDLREVMSRFPGRCRVCLEVDAPPQGRVVVETDVTVKPSQELLSEIEKRLGHESWTITKIGRL